MSGWRAFSTHLTPYGLFIFAGYLLAAWLCYRAAREWSVHPSRKRTGMRTMRQERTIWDVLALTLVVIAIYRQLDAADLVADAGRYVARARTVYGVRRPYQAAAAGFMMILAIGAMLAVVVFFRKVNPLAITAACFAFVLVVLLGITTISLHQIDAVLRVGIGRINVSNVLEAGSVAAIACAAQLYRRQSRVVRRR